MFAVLQKPRDNKLNSYVLRRNILYVKNYLGGIVMA